MDEAPPVVRVTGKRSQRRRRSIVVTPPFAQAVPGEGRLSRDDLAKCFHMPSEDACKALGVGLTMLKRESRRVGIKRWPFRAVQSIDRLITNVQTSGLPLAVNVPVKSVAELRAQRNGLMTGGVAALDDDAKRLQLAFSKSQHKDRAKQHGAMKLLASATHLAAVAADAAPLLASAAASIAVPQPLSLGSHVVWTAASGSLASALALARSLSAPVKPNAAKAASVAAAKAQSERADALAVDAIAAAAAAAAANRLDASLLDAYARLTISSASEAAAALNTVQGREGELPRHVAPPSLPSPSADELRSAVLASAAHGGVARVTRRRTQPRRHATPAAKSHHKARGGDDGRSPRPLGTAEPSSTLRFPPQWRPSPSPWTRLSGATRTPSTN